MRKVTAVPENPHSRLRYLYVKLNGKAHHLSDHSDGNGRDDEGDIVFTKTKTPHHRFGYKTTRTQTTNLLFFFRLYCTLVAKNNDVFFG